MSSLPILTQVALMCRKRGVPPKAGPNSSLKTPTQQGAAPSEAHYLPDAPTSS